MNKIVQHIWEAIRSEGTEASVPVFDPNFPIRSTGDMKTWYTGKPCEYIKKSHINCCVFDSRWEASEAFELDRNQNVKSWVKNDHLGFDIPYIYKGIVRKYWPDFIIKLKNDGYLILETKGKDTDQDKTKRSLLIEWANAVNQHGGFGNWKWAVSYNPSEVEEIIRKAIQ